MLTCFILTLLCTLSACTRSLNSDEQKEIFSRLFTSIYDAFDQQDESSIYDALAPAVEGSLLQNLYNQFSESLVIKEAEGKRAEVHRIQILQVTSTETASDQFTVKAVWEVEGVIAHEDHRHEQTIQYEGVFTVSKRSSSWKLTDGAILRQRRTAGSWEVVPQ